jgi:hypothetical protein
MLAVRHKSEPVALLKVSRWLHLAVVVDCEAMNETNDHLQQLHIDCVRALREYVAQANKTCKVLVNISRFPVSPDMRTEILGQRQAENRAHEAYQAARLALFRAAGWDENLPKE